MATMTLTMSIQAVGVEENRREKRVVGSEE